MQQNQSEHESSPRPNEPAEEHGAFGQTPYSKGEATESVSNAVENARISAAEGLDSAASLIRDKGPNLPGGQKVSQVAEAAARGAEHGAKYLRSQDSQAMIKDAGRFIRQHPAQSLLGALFVGYLVGRIGR